MAPLDWDAYAASLLAEGAPRQRHSLAPHVPGKPGTGAEAPGVGEGLLTKFNDAMGWAKRRVDIASNYYANDTLKNRVLSGEEPVPAEVLLKEGLIAPPDASMSKEEQHWRSIGRGATERIGGIITDPLMMSLMGGGRFIAAKAAGRLSKLPILRQRLIPKILETPIPKLGVSPMHAGFMAMMGQGMYEGGKHAYSKYREEGLSPGVSEELAKLGVDAGLMAAPFVMRAAGRKKGIETDPQADPRAPKLLEAGAEPGGIGPGETAVARPRDTWFPRPEGPAPPGAPIRAEVIPPPLIPARTPASGEGMPAPARPSRANLARTPERANLEAHESLVAEVENRLRIAVAEGNAQEAAKLVRLRESIREAAWQSQAGPASALREPYEKPGVVHEVVQQPENRPRMMEVRGELQRHLREATDPVDQAKIRAAISTLDAQLRQNPMPKPPPPEPPPPPGPPGVAPPPGAAPPGAPPGAPLALPPGAPAGAPGAPAPPPGVAPEARLAPSAATMAGAGADPAMRAEAGMAATRGPTAALVKQAQARVAGLPEGMPPAMPGAGPPGITVEGPVRDIGARAATPPTAIAGGPPFQPSPAGVPPTPLGLPPGMPPPAGPPPPLPVVAPPATPLPMAAPPPPPGLPPEVVDAGRRVLAEAGVPEAPPPAPVIEAPPVPAPELPARTTTGEPHAFKVTETVQPPTAQPRVEAAIQGLRAQARTFAADRALTRAEIDTLGQSMGLSPPETHQMLTTAVERGVLASELRSHKAPDGSTVKEVGYFDPEPFFPLDPNLPAKPGPRRTSVWTEEARAGSLPEGTIDPGAEQARRYGLDKWKPEQVKVYEESKAAVEADPEWFIQEYTRQNTKNGQIIINTDAARELFPAYAKSKAGKTANTAAVHEASSTVARMVYDRVLASPTPAGKEAKVFFTAGGPASGKSAIGGLLNGEYSVADIVMDGTLARKGAKTITGGIVPALQSGRTVHVGFVSALNPAKYDIYGPRGLPGIWLRAMKRANKSGRPVRIEFFEEAHSQTGAPGQVLWLKENRAAINEAWEKTGGKPLPPEAVQIDVLDGSEPPLGYTVEGEPIFPPGARLPEELALARLREVQYDREVMRDALERTTAGAVADGTIPRRVAEASGIGEQALERVHRGGLEEGRGEQRPGHPPPSRGPPGPTRQLRVTREAERLAQEETALALLAESPGGRITSQALMDAGLAKGPAVQAIRRLENAGLVRFDRGKLNYVLTPEGRTPATQAAAARRTEAPPPPGGEPQPTLPPPAEAPLAVAEVGPPPRRPDGALADEAMGDRPPAPGESFVVYRVGRKGTDSLAGNAANAEGVASHLINVEELGAGAGDTVHAFQVVVNKPFTPYQRIRGKGPAKGVGRGVEWAKKGRSEVVYSFGPKGPFTATKIGEVPVTREMYGDGATLTIADNVRAAFRDQPAAPAAPGEAPSRPLPPTGPPTKALSRWKPKKLTARQMASDIGGEPKILSATVKGSPWHGNGHFMVQAAAPKAGNLIKPYDAKKVADTITGAAKGADKLAEPLGISEGYETQYEHGGGGTGQRMPETLWFRLADGTEVATKPEFVGHAIKSAPKTKLTWFGKDAESALIAYKGEGLTKPGKRPHAIVMPIRIDGKTVPTVFEGEGALPPQPVKGAKKYIRSGENLLKPRPGEAIKMDMVEQARAIYEDPFHAWDALDRSIAVAGANRVKVESGVVFATEQMKTDAAKSIGLDKVPETGPELAAFEAEALKRITAARAKARAGERGAASSDLFTWPATLIRDAVVLGARAVRNGANSLPKFASAMGRALGSGLKGLKNLWRWVQSFFGPAPGRGAPVPPRPGDRGPRPPEPPPAAAAAPPPRQPRREPGIGKKRPVVEPTAEEMADATRFQGPLRPGEKPKATDYPINVERLTTEEGMRSEQHRLAEAIKARLNQNRTYRSWDEARAQAVASGLDKAAFERLVKERGSITDAEMEAGRIIREDLATSYVDKRHAWERAKKSDEIRPEEIARAEEEMLKAAAEWGAMTAHTTAAASEVARSLSILRKFSEGLSPQERLYQQAVKFGIRKGADQRLMDQLADAILSKDNSRIADLAGKIMKPGFMDKVNEFFINNILSSPATPAANVLGNWGHENLLRSPERYIAGVLEKGAAAREGRIPERLPGEAFQAMKANWQTGFGFSKNFARIARDTFIENPWDPGGSTLKGEFRPPALPGKFGRVWRTPGRALRALDKAARSAAYEAEVFARVYREGYNTGRAKGLTGESLKAHIETSSAKLLKDLGRWREVDVNRTLNGQKALSTAEKALYVEPKLYEIGKAAEQSARTSTFQDLPGSFTRAALRLRNTHPWLTLFVPFISTPSRIITQALARTPFGLARAGQRALTGQTKGGQRADELARGIWGTAISAGLYGLAESGFITGSGPTDARERSAWRKTGKEPYAVKFGDTWVSMARLEPMATVLGLAADLSEAKNAKKAGDVADKLMAAMTNNILSKSYLEGISGLIEAVEDPERFGSAYAKKFVGAFAVPNIIATAARATDPFVRETAPVESRIPGLGFVAPTIKSRIPGLSRTLPKLRTGTGEAIRRHETPLSRMLSPIRYRAEAGPEADLERVMIDVGYIPGRPPKSMVIPRTGGRRATLNQRERDVFASYMRRATAIARRMASNPRFRAADPLYQERALKKLFRDARDRAQQIVMPSVMRRGELVER